MTVAVWIKAIRTPRVLKSDGRGAATPLPSRVLSPWAALRWMVQDHAADIVGLTTPTVARRLRTMPAPTESNVGALAVGLGEVLQPLARCAASARLTIEDAFMPLWEASDRAHFDMAEHLAWDAAIGHLRAEQAAFHDLAWMISWAGYWLAASEIEGGPVGHGDPVRWVRTWSAPWPAARAAVGGVCRGTYIATDPCSSEGCLGLALYDGGDGKRYCFTHLDAPRPAGNKTGPTDEGARSAPGEKTMAIEKTADAGAAAAQAEDASIGKMVAAKVGDRRVAALEPLFIELRGKLASALAQGNREQAAALAGQISILEDVLRGK